MPLIQRNLFPAKKSSNKASGPFSIHGPEDNGSSSKTSRKISTGSKKKISKTELTKSSSLNSLSALNHHQQHQHPQQQDYIGKPALNNKHGGDSGHDSNDSDPSPASLSSSCGSVDRVGDGTTATAAVAPPPATTAAGAASNGISRKKILSRSRDAINHAGSNVHHHHQQQQHQQQQNPNSSDEYQSAGSTGSATIKSPDEDVWFNISTLIEEHIEEIVSKWDQIDDEIWAKVICMERNRRVAKAYARAPILTINGCDNGFDGHRIGLAGFTNPWRDKRVVELKKDIEQGVKLRMDTEGNLLVKKGTSKSDVFIVSDASLVLNNSHNHSGYDTTSAAVSSAESPQATAFATKLDSRAATTSILFDMRRFQTELAREMRSANPNTRSLEQHCFKFISFGKLSDELLNTPVWVIVINLVALEMIVKVLPNKLFDDNFYSLPTTSLHRAHYYDAHHPSLDGSSPASMMGVPPALPPRDLHNKKPPLTLPEPDYDDQSDSASSAAAGTGADLSTEDNNCGPFKVSSALLPPHRLAVNAFDDTHLDALSNHYRQLSIDDDPYYCGMQAHVPRYQRQDSKEGVATKKKVSVVETDKNGCSLRSNPPIVRRKFWSQSTSGFKFFGRKKKISLPETSPANQLSPYVYGSTSSYGNNPYYSTLYSSVGSTGGGYQPMPQTRASTLDYRSSSGGASSSGYYSNFSLLQSQYCIPVRDSDHLMQMMMYSWPHQSAQPDEYNNSHQNKRTVPNDNNEIYGVNTSLLRKSAFHRSISSPSLKNIFFSKERGAKSKDINNNHLRH